MPGIQGKRRQVAALQNTATSGVRQAGTLTSCAALSRADRDAHQILADEQVATGSASDVRWPLADWQGTVRDVATYNAATNVTTIANHKVYEAFGKVFSESGPTVDTIFGYTGRFFDDDTGLQWNTNRWYDPNVGRWLNEDPIGYSAGDPNLYRYVGNSVGDRVDPSGLAPPDEQQSTSGGRWVKTQSCVAGCHGSGPSYTCVWVPSPQSDADAGGSSISPAWAAGAGVGSVKVINGKTAFNVNGTKFYITGSQKPGMYKPKTNGNILYVYKASNPKKLYRLDYHALSPGGPNVLHHNQQGVATILNLNVSNHQVAGPAARTGARAIQIFKWGGRAMFVVGAVQSGIEIYYAEDRCREIAGQAGGWGGALGCATSFGWAGAKGGGFVGGLFGPEGIPVGAGIGGAVCAFGGGIGGFFAGEHATKYVYDMVFTPLEKEEWLVYEGDQ